MLIQTLEKTEGAIKINAQSRETGKIRHKRRRTKTKKNNKKHSTIGIQTQIT